MIFAASETWYTLWLPVQVNVTVSPFAAVIVWGSVGSWTRAGGEYIAGGGGGGSSGVRDQGAGDAAGAEGIIGLGSVLNFQQHQEEFRVG